jgi:hypothetical protein
MWYSMEHDEFHMEGLGQLIHVFCFRWGAGGGRGLACYDCLVKGQHISKMHYEIVIAQVGLGGELMVGPHGSYHNADVGSVFGHQFRDLHGRGLGVNIMLVLVNKSPV